MSRIVTSSEAEVEAELREGRRMRMGSPAAGPGQELVWVRIEPGDRYRLHSHPYEQTSVMLRGRMRLTVGDVTRDVGPGDMWHVLPDVKHGGELLDGGEVVFVDVYSPPSTQYDGAITYY